MKSVLYLGCPSAERADTEKVLVAAGVSVVWADNANNALTQLQHNEMPVLLDLSQGAAALDYAREIRTSRSSTLMFAVVDRRHPDLTSEAVLAGVADVFARPLGARRVANAIARELGHESAPSDPGENVHELYCHSPAMRDVLALVVRASTMRAGVMIRGAEGTGRQMVARAIHETHPLPKNAFVRVDCAALDADALEADLFGPVARSQNADRSSRGPERVSRTSRVCQANGGTLYLENIADAPSRVQARLARVLRDREAQLVETGETVSLDIRPMASVDPAFESAVHEGRVRDDLFRRISVIRIDMPPLRSRREDLPALANYFLRDICASLRVPPRTMSRSALALISSLPWRGNAGELRALLERVVAGLAAGKNIVLEDVLACVKLNGESVMFDGGGTLKQARARFEREYIAAMLEQHHGRISDAAKALGIQRTNLYRKMRTLRVTRHHEI
jgi:DNA-binding NtrC family response regulator